MKSRPLLAAALVAPLALILASCSGGASPEGGASEDSAPINVLMITSLTGPIANSAASQRDGLTAAVDTVNASGGILGRQVELTVVDDQLDPSVAANLLQQQLDSGTPDLIWHGSSSSVALSILPTIQREGVVSIACTAATAINDPKTFPYAFGILPSNDLETQAMIAYLEEEDVESVGLLTSDDANGQDTAAAYEAALDAAGIEWTNETYNFKDVDMTAQLSRLAAEEPDRIITQGYGAAAGYYLKSRTRLGITIPTIGASSLANGTNLDTITTASDWVNLELMAYPVNTPDSVNQERAAWDELFGQLSKVDSTAVGYTCGWDTLMTWKRAAEQAGSVEADKVKEALEGLDEVPEADLETLSFQYVEYSPESHFPILEPSEAFVITEPGPLVDGIVTP